MVHLNGISTGQQLIQTNCALTLSKSPDYFYTRPPTLSWATCTVSYYMSHFFPKETTSIIITASFIYHLLPHVCAYVHIYTYRCEGVTRRGTEKEYIHTNTHPICK